MRSSASREKSSLKVGPVSQRARPAWTGFMDEVGLYSCMSSLLHALFVEV